METEKSGTINCTVENTLLPLMYKKRVLTFCNDQTLRHTPKIRTEKSENFVAYFLSGLFTYQTKNVKNDM